MQRSINFVMTSPPGYTSSLFIELENEKGEGMKLGEWVERPDGWWALVITEDALRSWLNKQ